MKERAKGGPTPYITEPWLDGPYLNEANALFALLRTVHLPGSVFWARGHGPPLTRVSCPRDGGEAELLTEQTDHGAILIDLCPYCAGVWLDGGELEKITGEANVEIVLAQQASRPSDVKCPRCGSGMETKRLLDVEIDCCILCSGIWLDPTELEALQVAYMDHVDAARDDAEGELKLLRRYNPGRAISWAVREEARGA